MFYTRYNAEFSIYFVQLHIFIVRGTFQYGFKLFAKSFVIVSIHQAKSITHKFLLAHTTLDQFNNVTLCHNILNDSNKLFQNEYSQITCTDSGITTDVSQQFVNALFQR